MGQARTLTLQAVDARRFTRGPSAGMGQNSTALGQFSGSPMAPAAVVVVSSLTSMVIAFTMKETGNEELRQSHQKPKAVSLRKGWRIGGAVRITGI